MLEIGLLPFASFFSLAEVPEPHCRINRFAPSAASSLKKRKATDAAGTDTEKVDPDAQKKASLKDQYMAMMKQASDSDCRDGHRQGAVVK